MTAPTVGTAVTGRAAIAPAGTAVPTPTQGKALGLTLNSAFRNLGRRTTDGAPAWSEASTDGTDSEWLTGAPVSGSEGPECVMLLAEAAQLLDEIRTGASYDEHGHTTVDAGRGASARFVLFTEDLYRTETGHYLERVFTEVTVTAVKPSKPERGALRYHEVTFRAHRSAMADGAHHRRWLVPIPAE